MKVLINRICNKISGAEIYNLYLLKGLRGYKDFSITFSSDNSVLNKMVKQLGTKVIGVDPKINEVGTKKHLLLALFKLPLFYSRYLQLFKKVGDQNLYIFESMNEKIFLTYFLVILGKKVIWIEHGPLFSSRRALLIKWLYKFNTLFVHKIICVSESTKKDLLSSHIHAKKLITLYIGIDTHEFKPMDIKEIYRIKSQLRMENKSLIGFLGTVSKEKGIIDFIEIATLLSRDEKNIRFIVIGGGPLLNWAKEEVIKKNISDKFLFTDFISDVKKYLGILDVLVFPTYHKEGLSISLLEANAMGVPCVASNVGGNSEIIFHKKSGMLYKNSSFSSVKQLILDVLSDKKEFKLYARRVILDSFSLEENAEKYYQILKSVYEN